MHLRFIPEGSVVAAGLVVQAGHILEILHNHGQGGCWGRLMVKQGANPCSGSRREWLLDDGNSCADGLNRTHGATATIADARALRGDLYLKL